MSKVYDCFTFFNELDLLEIRLHELNPVVDYFVLVEATRTFQKQSKPLYYAENKERFREFSEKIIHVVVDDFPNFFSCWRVPKAWDYEHHQRNAIGRGLISAKSDDIIIISDIDEIPSASKVKEHHTYPGPQVFQQRLFYYFLNYAVEQLPLEACLLQNNGLIYWRGTVMLPYRDYASARATRNLRNDPTTRQIEEGGWHFSYIGGIDAILSKLKSFSHASEAQTVLNDLGDTAKVKEIVASGRDIFGRPMSFRQLSLSEPFPRYLVEHAERFSPLLYPL